MGGSDKICVSVDSWPAEEHVPYNFVLCLTLPLQLCLAALFFRNMRQSQNLGSGNPLSQRVTMYLTCSILSMLSSFYLSVVQPMVQTRYSRDLNSCRLIVLCAWEANCLCYLSLLEIFAVRLKGAFESTIYKVRRSIYNSIRVSFVIVFVIYSTLFSVKAGLTDCWARKHLGFLGNTAIFPNNYLTCTNHPKDHWLSLTGSGLLVLTVVVASSLLLYMYLSRLKLLNESMDTKLYTPIIEKSMVVAMVGMTSTMFTFIILLLTSFYAILFVDHLINGLMLFMMFNFGTPLYNSVFSSMVERIRDRFDILPKLQAARRVISVGSKTERDSHSSFQP